jgi:hypothetical protein
MLNFPANLIAPTTRLLGNEDILQYHWGQFGCIVLLILGDS